MNWPQTLLELADAGERFVIVTVGSTRGSTPRETGAKMFVTATQTLGTIGGGQLEYDCTALACRWFREQSEPETFSRRFTLGADCGQCCGGVAEILFEQVEPAASPWIDELRTAVATDTRGMLVTVGDSQTGVTKRLITATPENQLRNDVELMACELLRKNTPACRTTVSMPGNLELPALFEPLYSTRFEIVLFGAGHVGSAVVANLAALPCHVTWVDSRETVFPDRLPPNVDIIIMSEPEILADRLGGGRYFLVMTHSHAIDLQICARVLSRDDFSYCGLIGSRSKRRQFEKRLRALGLSEQQLQRLTCPIGIDGISGKKPAEIAIATTAQLLQLRESELALQQPVTKRRQRQHSP